MILVDLQSEKFGAPHSPLRGDATYTLVFGHHQLRSELYIDNADPSRVAAVYTALRRHKDRIEDLYGHPLSWDELPTRRGRRIADYNDGDVLDTDRYPQYIDWFLETQQRLRQTVDQVLPLLRAEIPTLTLPPGHG